MSTPKLPSLGTFTFRDHTLDIDYYLTREYGDFSEAANELPVITEWLNDMLQYYIATEIIEYRKVKQTEAEVYFELRQGGFQAKYGEKMTEKALEYAVEVDTRIIEAVASYADVKAWTVRLRNMIALFTSKLELLRTIEATRRHIDKTLSPS